MQWIDRITGYDIVRRSGSARLAVGMAINGLGVGLALFYGMGSLMA